MDGLAHITDGRERWGANCSIPRHVHGQAYAALVLSGSYEECGSRGRLRVGPGDVLLHDVFDSHLDRFRCDEAEILNLVTPGPVCGFGLGWVRDPDTIARVAERDLAEARTLLQEQLQAVPRASGDWPDMLAQALLDDPERCLGDWAQAHGLAAETISRGFGKVFGLTPAQFRVETRARRALALIRESYAPLAAIAAATGFADQAHMCRATRALTGTSPRAWRRSNPFKTVRARAG